MFRKWFVSALAVTAMAMLIPADAQAQLGKGGDEKGGGKGGGKTEPPAKGGGDKGGGKAQPPTRGGGGGQTQPPTRGGGDKGGGRAQPPTRGGGDKGGGRAQPPTRGGGGGQTQPPTRGGGDKGGGRAQPPTRGGGQAQPPTRGGGQVQPPNKGGGRAQPPTRGGGGGQTQPPTRGGGQVQPPNKGGGQTQPPTRGGGQTQPPTRGGGQVQPPNKGGGQTQPPTRGGGQTQPPTRGGGQTSGGLDKGTGGTRGNMPPERGRGGNGTQFQRDGIFKKTQSARTGQTEYGTSRNQITRSGSNNRITDAPNVHGWNKQDRDVFREDRTIAHDSRYRQGYNHYSSRWNDDCFYYPNYYFEYRPGYCFPSPFYYYPHVPGYIASIRVVLGDFRFYITARDRYEYRRPYNYGGYEYNYNRRDLIDYQIDNLVSAFEYGDISYASKMLPRNGYVHVALEDESDYRMYSDDFYDMLADIVEGTDTRSYRIRDVRYDRNQYVVYAEHEFVDPWGNIDRKYHTIVFQRDREGYEVAYFRVDRYPNW